MHSRHFVPSGTTQGALVQTAEVNFICPQCSSLYEVVKAKTSQDKNESPIQCPTCSGPLPAREAQFALKYLLWRKADRGWHRTPLGV